MPTSCEPETILVEDHGPTVMALRNTKGPPFGSSEANAEANATTAHFTRVFEACSLGVVSLSQVPCDTLVAISAVTLYAPLCRNTHMFSEVDDVHGTAHFRTELKRDYAVTDRVLGFAKDAFHCGNTSVPRQLQ